MKRPVTILAIMLISGALAAFADDSQTQGSGQDKNPGATSASSDASGDTAKENAGKTVKKKVTVTKDGNTVNRQTTATGPNGKTVQKDVTTHKNGNTVTREETTTLPNGKTVKKKVTTERNGDTGKRDSTVNGTSGGSVMNRTTTRDGTAFTRETYVTGQGRLAAPGNSPGVRRGPARRRLRPVEPGA